MHSLMTINVVVAVPLSKKRHKCNGRGYEALRLGCKRFSEFERSFHEQTLLIVKYSRLQLRHLLQM
jgi:hypothetical protein